MSCAVPQNKVKVKEYVQGYNEKEIEAITRVTGVETISICNEKTTSVDLAIEAAKCIDSEELKKVTAIVFVSQTRDYLLPQSSFIIQNALNLPEETFCIDVPVGCSGYIYGLFQANLLIQSGAADKVLILTADTNSKITNIRDKSTATIFGDAATATIIESGEHSSNIYLLSDGTGYDRLIVPAGNGGFRNPSVNKLETTLKEDGCYRSDSDIYMDGTGVMNFAITKVPILFKNFITENNIEISDWSYLILHQANKFMINYLRKKLGLGEEKVPICIDGFGNTGPSSIPLLLTMMNKELNLNQNKKTIVCGFGVGLSWGIADINLSKVKFYDVKNV